MTTRIEHVALWTRDPEALRDFYVQWFDARSSTEYQSRTRQGFRSYFLTLPGGGARIELMTLAHLNGGTAELVVGYSHLAIAVGSRSAVDQLTERMSTSGVQMLSSPRETGDGYYESVMLDPDGNQIEITI